MGKNNSPQTVPLLKEGISKRLKLHSSKGREHSESTYCPVVLTWNMGLYFWAGIPPCNLWAQDSRLNRVSVRNHSESLSKMYEFAEILAAWKVKHRWGAPSVIRGGDGIRFALFITLPKP